MRQRNVTLTLPVLFVIRVSKLSDICGLRFGFPPDGNGSCICTRIEKRRLRICTRIEKRRLYLYTNREETTVCLYTNREETTVYMRRNDTQNNTKNTGHIKLKEKHTKEEKHKTSN